MVFVVAIFPWYWVKLAGSWSPWVLASAADVPRMWRAVVSRLILFPPLYSLCGPRYLELPFSHLPPALDSAHWRAESFTPTFCSLSELPEASTTSPSLSPPLQDPLLCQSFGIFRVNFPWFSHLPCSECYIKWTLFAICTRMSTRTIRIL